MRYGLVVVWMLLGSLPSAMAQVSIGIGLPSVSIGINLPVYPELVRVPGYPVYYAPQLNSNFFFYDGMYWVYQNDNWYASSWYNGPWGFVGPEVVPLFVLRIPVRYYRAPPPYFRGWRADASPRWGEHWGREWEQHRSGWDRWNRRSAPAPAPLPVYQRQYSGDKYPRREQQQSLRNQNYRYQPHDAVVRQHYREQGVQRAPARSQQGQRGEDVQRSAPTQDAPQQRGAAVREQRQEPRQKEIEREQQTPQSSRGYAPQGRGASQEPGREQRQERPRDRGEERGQERNR